MDRFQCAPISILAVAVLLVATVCSQASALIIVDSANINDTVDPNTLVAEGLTYWDNVGWRTTRGTGVYLGDSWVITADHVGDGTITLMGQDYTAIPGTEDRIGSADLMVFRIENPPSLPSIPIRSDALSNGLDVRMIGTGLGQQPATLWNVNRSQNPWAWSETTSPGQAEARGYHWSSTRTKRWGTNEIYDFDGNSLVTTKNFLTKFDAGDTPYECSPADKDSGSGVFIQNGGQWELAGLVISLFGYSGQPANTSIESLDMGPTDYGGSEAIIVDLTYYRNSVIAATPTPNDISGDLNYDGFVDIVDLNIVLINWGQSVTTGSWLEGDPSGDGVVAIEDLNTVLIGWGQGTPP